MLQAAPAYRFCYASASEIVLSRRAHTRESAISVLSFLEGLKCTHYEAVTTDRTPVPDNEKSKKLNRGLSISLWMDGYTNFSIFAVSVAERREPSGYCESAHVHDTPEKPQLQPVIDNLAMVLQLQNPSRVIGRDHLISC